jgi:hypothetical protein
MLGDYERGFRRGRSPTDHISSLRIILGKSYEYNLDILQLHKHYS